MNVCFVVVTVCIFAIIGFSKESVDLKPNGPNIIIIVSDDLGWSDVGFTTKSADNLETSSINENIPETPILDSLANNGIVLENLYTQAICTPTRASLLTGKFAYKLGLMFASFVSLSEEESISTTDKLLSEDLADRNYRVHGVGKWHLGFKEEALPVNRGFDSFYGAYNGMGTYFSHRDVSNKYVDNEWVTIELDHDFHYDYRNMSNVVYTDISAECDGAHSTDLLTKAAVTRIMEHDTSHSLFLYVAYTAPHSPLEPNKNIVESRNAHIKDLIRRQYAAMVTQMDDGIGQIVNGLKTRNMWDNTFLLFMSDNGASIVPNCWDSVGGSNLPYRDGKISFFEGGIKSPAFVWSSWMSDRLRGTSSSALLHVVDIYPLLLAIADDKFSGTLSKEFINHVQDPATITDDNRDGGAYFIDVLNGNNTGRDTLLHNLVITEIPEDRMLYYCSVTQRQPASYAVIRHHQFKLFHGALWDWCTSHLLQSPCPELFDYGGNAVMLFDLELDPLEITNIASQNLDVVVELISMIEVYAIDAPTYWV